LVRPDHASCGSKLPPACLCIVLLFLQLKLLPFVYTKNCSVGEQRHPHRISSLICDISWRTNSLMYSQKKASQGVMSGDGKASRSVFHN
jgi:hypothetical protein